MKKESYLSTPATLRPLVLISLLPLVAGCSPAPSVVMFGATFPDWLLCSGIGVLVMSFLHSLLHKGKYKSWLEPAGLVYLCVTALAAMLSWLLFFPN